MLSNYKVLDITQIVAGPTCSRILAELGADVVKVELGPFGDRTRFSGLKPRKEGFENSSQSTFFFQHNHSKRSLGINFKSAEGIQLLLDMIPKFDVLVENFSPGVMARAGLDYESLKRINPRLVMCSISLAGQSGPISDKPGYDYIAQAYSGIVDLIGEPGHAPSLPGMAIGDTATGVAAAMAIGFALLHRERTGEGQYIDASLIDSYFQMHEVSVPRVSLRKNYVPTRTGSQHPDGGPTGIFRCGSFGYVAVAVLPHQWKPFVRALGRDELANDPRFAIASLRRDNNEVLKEILEGWLATFSSREDALAALEKHRIPCAPVLNVAEAMQHEQLRSRGTVRQVEDPALGKFDIPGFPVKFSGWKPDSNLKADLLGESNYELLQEFAGLTVERIDQLHANGVLVRDPALTPALEH